MPEATSEQETRHGPPLPRVHGNEAYFTYPSQVGDAYFSAVELMDERNHGWRNLDEERFHSTQAADKYWTSLYFGGCAPAPSEHNIDEAMWEPPFQSWPGALFSTNESSVLQIAETSAMNALSSLTHVAAQAYQTPWIQDSQMSSIQADQPWTNDNMDIWTQFETITSINTSDSRVCMFSNEEGLIGNEHGADCYNEEWNNVTSPNTFGGQASSLTAITGSTSSDGSSPPTEIETPTTQHDLAPSQPETNRRSRSSKGCDDCVCFLVMNGKLAGNDGYEWRKYGQKKIKGTTHPRAYYRCARQGCLVKKQVENSSDTECAVLITYFNRHNHHQ